MQDEVRNMRATRAPELLREARVRHAGSFLSDAQWDDFLLIYKGDVDKALADYITWADAEIAKINGIPPIPGPPNVALIPDAADLCDSLARRAARRNDTARTTDQCRPGCAQPIYGIGAADRDRERGTTGA
jgi:hypothetical protein